MTDVRDRLKIYPLYGVKSCFGSRTRWKIIPYCAPNLIVELSIKRFIAHTGPGKYVLFQSGISVSEERDGFSHP